MDAALRLGAKKSSLEAIGLRELAREAGLNPNTFYRHFGSIDDLALAIVEHFGAELRRDRNQARDEARDFESFLAASLGRYFDYAARHPQAFVLGFRELTAPTKVRTAVRKLMSELSHELVLIMRHFGQLPQLGESEQAEVAAAIIQQLFMLTLDYVEQPKRRPQIVQQALRIASLLVRGADASAKPTAKRARKR